jgi:DNA primase
VSYLDTIVSFAHDQLDDDACDYLTGRGVTDEQIDLFRIGVLRGEVPALPVLGAAPFYEWLKDGGSIDNVLVFPLTNVLGEVFGFQFRSLAPGGRYREFFHGKEAEAVTFGLAQAAAGMWETRAVWLVEGVFDCLPLARHFPATLPVLSVRITDAMLRQLRRLVGTVYIGYDMDSTGRQAAESFRQTYGRDFDVRIVTYPRVQPFGKDRPIKDPGELWEAWGDDPLRDFVHHTVKEANGKDL